MYTEYIKNTYLHNFILRLFYLWLKAADILSQPEFSQSTFLNVVKKVTVMFLQHIPYNRFVL